MTLLSRLILIVMFFVTAGSVVVRADDSKADAKAEKAETSAEKQDDHAKKDDHGNAGGHNDETDRSHANGTPMLNSPAAIGFDLSIWTFVVFALLMAMLTKFAWGPISQGLDARENHISGMIATAEKNAHDTEARLKELEARLAAQAEEAREAINAARKEGMQQKEKILAEAQEAVRIEKDRASEEIQTAKNAALREIAQKSVNTAVSLATSIIRREVKAADHTAIINDALTQFQNRN